MRPPHSTNRFPPGIVIPPDRPLSMVSPVAVARNAPRAAFSLAIVLACVAAPAFAAEPTRTRDVSTERLLDKLLEREQDMADVAGWVLDRIDADAAADAALKREVPFRRAQALIAQTRTATDSKKQVALLDQAKQELDRFLATGPAGRQAIEAFSLKGNLLLQRGRSLVLQASRPGADADRLRAEALPFFDEALKSLQGTAKPGEKIEKATNAEDAALQALAEVEAEIKALNDAKGPDAKDGDKKPPQKPRRNPKDEKRLEQLEEDQEAFGGQVLGIRFLVAEAVFEKAAAFAPDSPERRDTVEQSAKLYKALGAKYTNTRAEIVAKFHEGRNYAELGKWDQAEPLLAAAYGLDDVNLADTRAKALSLVLDRWLAEKKFDQLDDKLLKFVLTPTRDPRKLDPGWLAAKYRAAAFLEAKAEALPASEKAKRDPLRRDARKLAVEVATAGKDFAKEARDLASRLGKDVDVAPTEQTFKTMVEEARLGMETMRAKQAEAKELEKAGKADEATAAFTAASAARDAALKAYEDAVKMGLEKKEDANEVASAVAQVTMLLYDAKKFREAAERGSALVKENPDARGGDFAARIALASWQQLARDSDAAAAAEAKKRMLALADFMVKKWPDDPAGDDALATIVGAALETRNPDEIAAAVKALPADSPKRPELLQRVGSALWREVQEKRRLEESLRPDEQALAGWKSQAKAALDQGLAAAAEPPTKIAVSAALSRLLMALEDGDMQLAGQIIDNPAYGPWAAVQAGGDFGQGPLAESSLTASLRYFIQTQQLDKAQQAMERLEKTAGDPTRLTALYLAMGRDLQGQLEALAGNAAQPEVRDRAAKVLSGFENFLEKLRERDDKVSSQMWVATTYQSLGSGKGTGAVVPRDKAQGFLDRAAATFDGLLAKGGDEIAKFEPSIRLRLAGIYRERGKFAEAQEQIDRILADPKRQNMLDVQVQAAEILQAAGMAAASTEADKADRLLGQATVGRKDGGTVIWGWGGISKKLASQAGGGGGAAEHYFEARMNIAKCMLARALLPGKAADKKATLLGEAKRVIAFTRQTQPTLGGESTMKRFEKLLKDIQKAEGLPETGFRELDDKEQALKPVAAAASK